MGLFVGNEPCWRVLPLRLERLSASDWAAPVHVPPRPQCVAFVRYGDVLPGHRHALRAALKQHVKREGRVAAAPLATGAASLPSSISLISGRPLMAVRSCHILV